MNNMNAFPTEPGTPLSCEGMTLRDYFAAKAMAALLSDQSKKDESYEVIAGTAYIAADAMMQAREDE
jgi:hypothetical protein